MKNIMTSSGIQKHKNLYRKTVKIPLNIKFHHIQFPAIPYDATIPVTAKGVSAENVVATIDTPASHHGIRRPALKKPEIPASVFFFMYTPAPSMNNIYIEIRSQSSLEKVYSISIS